MRAPDRLRRRDLLRASAVGIAAAAGCASDGSEDSSPSNETPAKPTDGGGSREWPVSGAVVPELRPLEEATLDYMREREITAGALAVARYGSVVYERGFGWNDRTRTEPVSPDALFRIGSVSKPITAAAVRRLLERDERSLGEHVYPLLDVEAPSGEPADARFHEIEFRHLLAHQGGWDRREQSDPLFRPLAVADELDLGEAPDADDVVEYVLERPLQFDPGTRTSYSNVGYALLASAIEGATGRSYHDYVMESVLEPAGATDVFPGRTAPDDRHPREVAYDDSEQCPNGLELDPGDSVACADGGIVLEALEGACGHVASAGSLLAFMNDYWLNGEPRESTDGEWVYFGSLPGSFAMVTQRPDGVDVAALFNRRTGDAEGIHPILSNAIAEVDEWPY